MLGRVLALADVVVKRLRALVRILPALATLTPRPAAFEQELLLLAEFDILDTLVENEIRMTLNLGPGFRVDYGDFATIANLTNRVSGDEGAEPRSNFDDIEGVGNPISWPHKFLRQEWGSPHCEDSFSPGIEY